MVGKTDSIFFESATNVSNVATMVCVTQRIISLPETRGFARQTIVLIPETMFPISARMISGLDTIISISKTIVRDTETIVRDTETIVRDTKTIFSNDR